MIDQITNWLNNFEKCVTNKDYNSAKALYSYSAKNFGTRNSYSSNMDEYVENQWKVVWELSRMFKFNDIIDYNKHCNYVSVTWQNETKIGSVFTLRQGRATFIFENFSGNLRCVHSHFSTLENIYSI
jgi:hypothetical protein